MSNALKLVAVMGFACVSAIASATIMIRVMERGQALHAEAAHAAAIAPAAAPGSGPTAQIAKAHDGHYWANADVDGASIHFLVDTGATAVALTPADARRLGIEPSRLTYGYRVMTAAGEAHAAQVKLASVSVSGAKVDNVDALVIDKGLDASLLGMSYLGRLASFQATREALILQP